MHQTGANPKLRIACKQCQDHRKPIKLRCTCEHADTCAEPEPEAVTYMLAVQGPHKTHKSKAHLRAC